MVVAAADVRVDDEVVGASLDGQVVDRHELLGELLEVGAFDVGEFAALLAAGGKHAPGAVVELQVAASRRVEVADDRAVARGDGLDERLVRRVDLARALDVVGQDHLLEELGRCRDRLLGDGVLVLERVHELEVLDERMVLGRERAREPGVVDQGRFAVEADALVGLLMCDALKAPHEIEVPGRAAELAVGDDVIAGRLLLGDELADAVVFDGLELISGDGLLRKLLACFLEPCGAQETADVIEAERCGKMFAHDDDLLNVYEMNPCSCGPNRLMALLYRKRRPLKNI